MIQDNIYLFFHDCFSEVQEIHRQSTPIYYDQSFKNIGIEVSLILTQVVCQGYHQFHLLTRFSADIFRIITITLLFTNP